MRNFWRIAFAVFTLASVSFWAAPASAQENNLVLAPKSADRIDGLRLDAGNSQVESKDGKFTALIEATFDPAGRVLIWDWNDFAGNLTTGKLSPQAGQPSRPAPVQLTIPLIKREILLRFRTLSSSGKVLQRQEVRVYVAENAVIRGAPATFVPSMGISAISYRETGVPDFTEIALTFKAGYSRTLIAQPWSWRVSGFFTLLPLNTNQDGNALRFFGLNAQIGYSLRLPDSSWRFMFLAGGYYTTTFSTNAYFGFQNMYGPALFPVAQYTLSAKLLLSGYLKYSPIVTETGLAFSNSREVATGLGFTRNPGSPHPVSLSVDLANLKLNFSDIVLISSTTLSLSVGWGI